MLIGGFLFGLGLMVAFWVWTNPKAAFWCVAFLVTLGFGSAALLGGAVALYQATHPLGVLGGIAACAVGWGVLAEVVIKGFVRGFREVWRYELGKARAEVTRPRFQGDAAPPRPPLGQLF